MKKLEAYQEVKLIFKSIVGGALLVSVPFGLFTDYFSIELFPPVIWAILLPLFSTLFIIGEAYGIPLFFPYLFIKLFVFLRKKFSPNFLTSKKILYLFVSIFTLLSQFAFFIYWFDCDVVINTERVTEESNSGFFFKGRYHVCFGCLGGVSPVSYDTYTIDDIDFDTFENLGNGYAKDKNGVYYDNFSYNCLECVTYKFDITKILNADPETFEVFEGGGSYAKDKNHVYIGGKLLKGAHVNSFEVLEHGYSKDDTSVFYSSGVIEKADSKTFEVLTCGYAKDSTFVFYDSDVIEKADSKTFVHIDGCHFKDKDHVYEEGTVLQGVDPETFSQ